MNSAFALTTDNLLYTLPDALKNDEKMYALAASISDILSARSTEIESLIIYNRVDMLPEPLLDALAYDFKVDWWDAEYTLEQKRRTLKSSWNVHRMLGTKSAVETAISAIYPDTKVVEWFDYSAEPYHFKLRIDATYQDVDPIKHKRVLERINYYKNLRSYLEGIEYYMHPEAKATAYAGATGSGIHIVLSVPTMETADRLTPRGKMLLGIGIAAVCITGVITAAVKIYGNDMIPKGKAATNAGIGVHGAKIQICTEVKIYYME